MQKASVRADVESKDCTFNRGTKQRDQLGTLLFNAPDVICEKTVENNTNSIIFTNPISESQTTSFILGLRSIIIRKCSFLDEVPVQPQEISSQKQQHQGENPGDEHRNPAPRRTNQNTWDRASLSKSPCRRNFSTAPYAHGPRLQTLARAREHPPPM